MEKVCNIIGMGRGAANAPWKNKYEAFFGINNAYIYGDITKLFLMHQPKRIIDSCSLDGRTSTLLEEFKSRPKMEAVSLKEFNIEEQENGRTLLNYHPETPEGKIIRKVEKYPLSDVTSLMGTTYFTCSAAYLIGLAILEGFERIRLYGFEIWSKITDEYFREGPCVEAWINLAKGRGIKVDIDFSVLPTMREENNLYGYKDDDLNNENNS